MVRSMRVVLIHGEKHESTVVLVDGYEHESKEVQSMMRIVMY